MSERSAAERRHSCAYGRDQVLLLVDIRNVGLLYLLADDLQKVQIKIKAE
jgi:hypothetical protein